MKWRNLSSAAGAGVVLLLMFSGCTVIGYEFGYKLDRAAARAVVVSPYEALHVLDTGDEVRCVMRDSTRIHGEYAGTGIPHGDTLLPRLPATPLEDCAQRARVRIGDELRMERVGHDFETVTYLNADRERIHFRTLGQSEVQMTLFRNVELITRCGGSVVPQPYKKRYDEGMFESVHHLCIATDEGVHYVDTSEIALLAYTHRPTGGRLGFALMGLAADVIILSQALKKEKKPEPVHTGGGAVMCGCPFLFGWSGEEWRMETECFSGSVFRAAQRRDWARLEFTAPRDGIMRLRLRNLLQEIDSIDHLALLRVEHDAELQVYPTEDGRMIAAAPQPPDKAWDDRGKDILPSITDRDGEGWLALPHAAESAGTARRWMECEFPRPADSDSVTLILRVKNTDWGARMHANFFSLFGSGLQSQYDLWNSDPAARAALHEALLREGMLEVSLWEGSDRRVVGHVWEVGVGEYRAVALRVDITGARDEVLRLRFEAPAAIWMIGSVGMSPDPPGGVQVRRFAPAVALRGDGSDCRAPLSGEDGDYLVLDTGELADVDFHVPTAAVPAGRTVTWVVESSGYYRMKFASPQPPQAALLEQMFREPGFFARYSDAEFRKAMLVALP